MLHLFVCALTVKVRLAHGEDIEVRKVNLPGGASTTLGEAIQLFARTFERRLLPSLRYEHDGDTVAVRTSAEFQDALAAEATEADRAAAVSWSQTITFWLNGERQVLTNPSPTLMLVDWLREAKGLTGTKVGCHVGECGICPVSIAFGGPKAGEEVSVNSCLRRVVLCDGCHVTTTEGLGGEAKGFHAVQKAIADGNGSQCGYCTPGWVMQMYSLLRGGKNPSRRDIEHNFDGVLCRCTGYRPILENFGEFAEGGCHSGSCERVRLPPELLAKRSRESTLGMVFCTLLFGLIMYLLWCCSMRKALSLSLSDAVKVVALVVILGCTVWHYLLTSAPA